jgi:hypothetical protein
LGLQKFELTKESEGKQMNDYQLKREKTYLLPQTVYRQALYAVKDLERLKKKLLYMEEDAAGISSSDPSVIMSRGGAVSDITGNRASEMALTESRIEAIETAFERVPPKYRNGLKDKLIYDIPINKLGYSVNTWKKWQQVLLYHVAVNLNIL